MDDFITYKNLSQYCILSSQIIERANDKTEALNSRWQVSCPTSAPLTLKTAWQPATFGQRVDSVARRWFLDLIIKLHHDIWMVINVLHPFGWNFDPYPFCLAQSSTFYGTAIQLALTMMSQNRATDYDRLQRENDTTSIWSLNGKFACCIRRLIIWCSKTERIYWKFQSCKPDCWCPCPCQVTIASELNQERSRRWRKCRQLVSL